MKPIFFETGAEFRKWLNKNHEKETELLVGFYKVGSGKPSMTWSESVDEALCFGWIDGVRKSMDDKRYTIRFTPRKPEYIPTLQDALTAAASHLGVEVESSSKIVPRSHKKGSSPY